MEQDVVAKYRNEQNSSEIDVVRDPCEGYNPLSDETWLRFLTLSGGRHRSGTEQMTREELDDEVEEACKGKALVLPVYMVEHGMVGFNLGEFNDPWDSGQCGFIIVTVEGLKDVGLDREKATEQIGIMLEQYGYWCNGAGFAYVIYKTQKCDLGHVHREEEERETGFLGTSMEHTGLLEEAGIRTTRSTTLNKGWEQVPI